MKQELLLSAALHRIPKGGGDTSCGIAPLHIRTEVLSFFPSSCLSILEEESFPLSTRFYKTGVPVVIHRDTFAVSFYSLKFTSFKFPSRPSVVALDPETDMLSPCSADPSRDS
jgi:hypothetical protein